MSEEMRKSIMNIEKAILELLTQISRIQEDVHKIWEMNDRMYGKAEETTDEENKTETDQKQL